MRELSGLAAGDQITGARDYQEDFFRIVKLSGDEFEHLLLILADGMGGHAGGDRASELAVTVFAEHFEKTGNDGGDIGQRLRESLDAANAAIGEDAEKDPRYAEMGCTLLACLITANELHWVSVGDSPMWLLRGNSITRLNDDHSMRPALESLVELGRMSAEELANDPRVNQLRSVLVGQELPMVDQNTHPLSTADRVILASDGLETLAVDEIRNICMERDGPEKAVAALLNEIKARQQTGQDNTTAVIYDHTGESTLRNRTPEASTEEQSVSHAPERADGFGDYAKKRILKAMSFGKNVKSMS